jgi:hypothetical protein
MYNNILSIQLVCHALFYAGLPGLHHLSTLWCCMGISKVKSKLLEMEEIGKVPVSGK